jgi:hypothetical protein
MRDEFLEKYPTGFDRWDREKAQALDALIESVRAETRAAILADEGRRVWCHGYVNGCKRGWDDIGAKDYANTVLTAWREARAAWEAR